MSADWLLPDTMSSVVGVCGMLGDKDVHGVVTPLAGRVEAWFAAHAEGPRALTVADLIARGLRMTVEQGLDGDDHARRPGRNGFGLGQGVQ